MLASRREAEAEAAEALAQLDDDETRDAGEIERTKEAWLTGGVLSVDVSRCDFTKPLTEKECWPVVCKTVDATAPKLCALQENADFKSIMRAANSSLRRLRLQRPLTPEDFGAYPGASVIAAAVGFHDDGTIKGMIWFQKRVRWLEQLKWNYAGSTVLQCGLEKTFKAPNCVVCSVALVEGVNADEGEGCGYEGMLIATGLMYACQCVPGGVSRTTRLALWAPEVLEVVLADEKHHLHEYAKQGIAPPLMAPKPSEERSKLAKEALANISPAARKRMHAGGKKGYEKSGTGLRGKENLTNSTKLPVVSRYGGYASFVLIAEALECIQHKRKPASWAAGKLTPAVLKRLAKAGLADTDFGPCFVTVLPEEEKKGRQLFCIEGFRFEKEGGTMGPPHLWDWTLDTQRGAFPAYDVAVALSLVREGERAPKLPWGPPSWAPVEVTELIDRALAWSPPQPSPPPTKKPRSAPRPKKPRSAPPRRSGRLNK